jgi:hypothetical protein
MGTRADFYVGKGQGAEWLGSVGWDGYPDGIEESVLAAKSEADYRAAVEAMFAERDDVTRPADGWPWPWDDSQTTDFAYAFDAGEVHAACFGRGWFNPRAAEVDGGGEDTQQLPQVPFPRMTERRQLALDSQRSGLIVLGATEGPREPAFDPAYWQQVARDRFARAAQEAEGVHLALRHAESCGADVSDELGASETVKVAMVALEHALRESVKASK